MNINALPDEMLVRILSFLNRSDRLESALTCRRWAQTVAQAPPLLRDICLVIKGPRAEEAETVLGNSHRQYERLRLEKGSLFDSNATCWTKVGSSLRHLTIFECNCSPKMLYSLLQTCSSLESLAIHGLPSEITTFQSSELPQGTNLESIQRSMRNMHHLHLNFPVNADILEHLLILMPNVSSIALFGFDAESDFLSRLPKILGTSRSITMLNLCELCIFDDAPAQSEILKISSFSLRTLICSGRTLSSKAYDALLNCTMLRYLIICIEICIGIDSRLLHGIIRNNPKLESISIFSDVATVFTLEDLMPIFDLRNLRVLYISLYLKNDSERDLMSEFLCELAKMWSLETLWLGFRLGVVDSARFRILTSLPMLRNLEIQGLRWEAESLKIVLFDLKKLKTLAIYDSMGGSRVICDQHSELDQNPLAAVDRIRSGRQVEFETSCLEVLKFERIPLADAWLGCITAHHTQLRVVHLLDCENITDAGIVALFKNEPCLEELRIRCKFGINGTCLDALEGLCPRLRILELPTCAKISRQALKALESRKPRVNIFHV